MNILELKKAIQSLGLPDEEYSLNGGFPNEAYCIGQLDHKWETYYSERGNKNNHKIFETEDDACRDMLDRVTYEMSHR